MSQVGRVLIAAIQLKSGMETLEMVDQGLHMKANNMRK